jgi:hypothetical protein
MRHCLLYEYNRGSSAKTAYETIKDVYGADRICYKTVRKWFKRFRQDDSSFKDLKREGDRIRIVFFFQLKRL